MISGGKHQMMLIQSRCFLTLIAFFAVGLEPINACGWLKAFELFACLNTLLRSHRFAVTNLLQHELLSKFKNS